MDRPDAIHGTDHHQIDVGMMQHGQNRPDAVQNGTGQKSIWVRLFCDMPDNYPEEAKFRWTCEAMWPVNEYLRSRPAEQIERLKKRVAERRIEIAGMYFNFDELPDEQILAASLQIRKNFQGLSN